MSPVSSKRLSSWGIVQNKYVVLQPFYTVVSQTHCDTHSTPRTPLPAGRLAQWAPCLPSTWPNKVALLESEGTGHLRIPHTKEALLTSTYVVNTQLGFLSHKEDPLRHPANMDTIQPDILTFWPEWWLSIRILVKTDPTLDLSQEVEKRSQMEEVDLSFIYPSFIHRRCITGSID